ncbi:hypothetical protein [Streptomyces mirabilis]|uniref:hypothetical protein n=1 Tax=Streptomyces mirabilis TaxID=68239 RepID=UPI003D9E67C9
MSLAVLSAITHGKGPRAAAILGPLAAALETIDPVSAALLVELVTSGLVDSQAKEIWRDLMAPVNYFFKNPAAQKVREETRVEDWSEVILNILKWRDIEVPDPVRLRVRACSDLDQLKIWSERAIHVTEAAQLFDGDGA